MNLGLTREEALRLLEDQIENPNMVKHCLAAEAVIRALARHLGENEEQWGLAGLLHDLDAEKTRDDFSSHGLEAYKLLEERGVDSDVREAILMHNEEAAGKPRSSPFHHALAAGETITGLIIATTLVYPDKRLAIVKAKSIVKRMKEKAFAASVNRDAIRECEKLDIPLPEFAELALRVMQDISGDLGL